MIRLLLFQIFLIPVLTFAQRDTFTLTVQPASSLVINGKTNVNKYSCSILHYTGSDTLQLTGERGKGATFTSGEVNLAATEFDCGVRVITNDFQQTINAEQYPNITIQFISFEQEPTFKGSDEKFKGKLKLSLAGSSKGVEIRAAIKKDEAGYFHLTGNKNFTFSDFSLTPPSKMFGAVKVDDKIIVNFHLVLQKL